MKKAYDRGELKFTPVRLYFQRREPMGVETKRSRTV